MAAVLIVPSPETGYTDSVAIRSCTVLEIRADEARVISRCGSKYPEEWVKLSSLSSSVTRFASRVEPFLSTLLRRAPQPAVAVKTADGVEVNQLTLTSNEPNPSK
jgi:hypothetical protein